MKSVKNALLGAALAAAVMTVASAPVAYASSYPMHQTRVNLDGTVMTTPWTLVANSTTYMPIWYVMHIFDGLHIQSHWDGRNWDMEMPSDVVPDLTNISVGTGPITISMNGHIIHRVYGITYIDPASKRDTMYIPIWYVMQVLNRIGIASVWQVGVNDPLTPEPPGYIPPNEWTMYWGYKPPTAGTAGYSSGASPLTTKLSLIESFMSSEGVSIPAQTTANPFDDVASADWPIVSAALAKGYIQADSSTHFGSNDPVSVHTADEMYWNYLGIPPAHASAQPGGEPFAWGNIIGLNTLVSASPYMSQLDQQQFLDNLTHLKQGYFQDGAGFYHPIYPVKDEYGNDVSLTTEVYSDFNQTVVEATPGYLKMWTPYIQTGTLRLSFWGDMNAYGSRDGGQSVSDLPALNTFLYPPVPPMHPYILAWDNSSNPQLGVILTSGGQTQGALIIRQSASMTPFSVGRQ